MLTSRQWDSPKEPSREINETKKSIIDAGQAIGMAIKKLGAIPMRALESSFDRKLP